MMQEHGGCVALLGHAVKGTVIANVNAVFIWCAPAAAATGARIPPGRF
jgi:hypothetical protein